jgi:hypothetical protein
VLETVVFTQMQQQYQMIKEQIENDWEVFIDDNTIRRIARQMARVIDYQGRPAIAGIQMVLDIEV